MKPIQDSKAECITFGVELETTIPAACGVTVGGYHCGNPVVSGYHQQTGAEIPAPEFNGKRWKAERDGSIHPKDGTRASEFVSPILRGSEGVETLLAFVDWVNAIGATVNASCGCHITVGVESIIGTRDPQALSEYARKLAHIARWHAMSLYGQTGTGRHMNRFSHMLGDDVGELVRRMESTASLLRKAEAAERCGRGMVNFKKLFSHGLIEFRVFAGTVRFDPLRQGTGRPVIDWPAVRRYFEAGHTVRQTAEHFDMSMNTVKTRLQREGWTR